MSRPVTGDDVGLRLEPGPASSSGAFTVDGPGHRKAGRAVVAALVVAAAIAVGVVYDAADRRPATLVERAGSPLPGVTTTTGPARESAGPAVLDLSMVRALPPAGTGAESSPEAAGPTDLAIPSLGVDGAPVVPVGIDAGGGLEIPQVDEVGWYRLGARPGAGAGSIVLAAHVAYDGEDGVFRHLGSLEPGAAVTVTTGEGSRVDYRVDSVSVHRKADLPIDDLFSPSSPERLVLITCGGAFNPELRHYDSNIVVIATPVPHG